MVNYSHIIGEALELMQKSSVIDSPFGGAPEKAPRWDLTGTEGCGSGNRVSWCSWMFSGYMDIYIGGRSRSVELRGAHEGGGAPRGAGAPPCLVASSLLS